MAMTNLPPFHFVGTPAPVSEAEIDAHERAAGGRAPEWLRAVAGTWGFGTVADLFHLGIWPWVLGETESAVLAAKFSAASTAKWLNIGGDEGRNFTLVYAPPARHAGFYALLTNDERSVIPIGKTDDAFLTWVTGPGLERTKLFDDAIGAPSPTTYAVPGPTNLYALLLSAFKDHRLEAADEAIATALTTASRHRLAWEAVNMLLEPSLEIADTRRKELMQSITTMFKKNVAKTIARQSDLAATVRSVLKTGKLLVAPPTSLVAPPGVSIPLEWNETRTFVAGRGHVDAGTWLVRIWALGQDGIERLHFHMVIPVAAGEELAFGGTMLDGPRWVRIEVLLAGREHDAFVRGVDVYHFDDGSIVEDSTGGQPPAETATRRLHREGGPAVLKGNPYYAPTTERWYRHGKPHRDDGPAVVVPCYGKTANDAHRGMTAYYVDGVLHREHGPAVRYANGDEEHWIRGTRV
jgi:hypothetical protein